MLVVYVKIYKVHAGSNFYGRSSGAVQSGDWYCNQVQVGGVAGEVMRLASTPAP